MNPVVHEWLNLIVRWAHVIAAIMWIGDSFLFMWLDSQLRKPSQPREGDVVGELWMAHSGGFYEVVKRKSLAKLPDELHWFKWESYTTWISGFLLLVIVYGLGGKVMLVDAGGPMSHVAAVHLSLGLLVGAVVIYDLLCRTPLVKSNKAFGVVGLALIAGAAWGIGHVFNARATFLQIGAMLGTVMASNVFFRIIPAQKHMLAATKEGRPVDTSYGARAKQRSTHNHYLTLPVLFTMLSNHFPSVYGHAHAWLVLALLVVAGAGVKLVMNLRKRTPWPVLIGTSAAIASVGVMTAPRASSAEEALRKAPAVSFATAQSIVQSRCTSCHAEKPGGPLFAAAPANVMLDTPARIAAQAGRVYARAVATHTMPLGNMTGMSEMERAMLGAWILQGADVNAPGPVQASLPGLIADEGLRPGHDAARNNAAEEAEVLYQQRCVLCHGASGHGDGPAAAGLNPKPRNYADAAWRAATSDEQIGKAIVEGGQAVGKSPLMPANPDLAQKPAVLQALIKKLRSF